MTPDTDATRSDLEKALARVAELEAELADQKEASAHNYNDIAQERDAALAVVEAARRLAPLVERQTTEWIALRDVIKAFDDLRGNGDVAR